MRILNAFLTVSVLGAITILYACLKVAGLYDTQEEERIRKLCQQKKEAPDTTTDAKAKPDTKTEN